MAAPEPPPWPPPWDGGKNCGNNPCPPGPPAHSANGHDIWHQLSLQFMWVCIVLACVTGACALLHKPFSLLVALSVRGDLLLPKPKASAERSEEDAALLAEDAAPSPPQVAEERLGQRMRRLLEHYVGSEDHPPFELGLMHALHATDLVLSLLTVLFWIFKSYSNHVPSELFRAVEFLFGLFFAAFYCLRLLRARLRPLAAFSPVALVDLLTLVPLFLQATPLRTYINFSFGRAPCALWAYEALEAQGAVDNMSDVRRRLTLLALRFVALVISFAGTMFVFEVLGDPAGLQDSFVSAEMGELSFYQMCYFVFMTVSTVGYGDYAPKSLLGRALAVLLIGGGVAFFSVETAELLAISQAEASGRGRFHPSRKGGHVLVAGGAVVAGGPTLAGFLQELLQPRPGLRPPQVLLLAGEEPGEALRALLRSRWARPHVTLLLGSTLEARDLGRARADSAACAFLLAEAGGDGDEAAADEAAVMAAAALHRAHPRLPLRLLLCRGASLPLARTAGLPDGCAVTAAHIAPRLLALAALAPAAATLACNLLRAPALRPPPGAARAARWAAEYLHGAAAGAFGGVAGEPLAGEPFLAAAARLHAQHGVTLLALQRRGRLLLAPARERLRAGDVLMLAAHSAPAAAAALASPPAADWRALYLARREEARRAAGEAAQRARAPTPEPPPDAAAAAAAAAATAAAGDHVLLLAPHLAAGCAAELWEECGEVLASLRAPHLPQPPAVLLLSPAPPPPALARAGLLWQAGGAGSAAALRRAGAASARACLVLSGPPQSSRDPGMLDRRGLLAATLLQRQAAGPRLALELHAPASLGFLPPPGGGGEEALRPQADCAAGRATFRSDVARLLGAEPASPAGLELLQRLLRPEAHGRAAALWAAPLAPARLAAAAEGGAPLFGRLFAQLAAEGALALGLLRGGGGDPDAPPGGYLAACPPAWLPLRADDAVFVLADSAWARRNVPGQEALGRDRAAGIVQRAWRLSRARAAAAERQ